MSEISSQMVLVNQQKMSSIDPKQDSHDFLRGQMPITAVRASMNTYNGVQSSPKSFPAHKDQENLATTPPSQTYKTFVPPQYSHLEQFPTFPGSRSPLDRWVPLNDDDQTEKGEEYSSLPRMRDHSPSNSAKLVAATNIQSPEPLYAVEKSVSPTDDPENLLFAPAFLVPSRSDPNLVAASYYPARPSHRLSMPGSSSSSSLAGRAKSFPTRPHDNARSHAIRSVDPETMPTQNPQTASSQPPRKITTPKPKPGFGAADLSSDSPILGFVSGSLPVVADPRQNRNSENNTPVALVPSSPTLEVPMVVAAKHSYMQRDPRPRSTSISAAASASSSTLTEPPQQQAMGIAFDSPTQYGRNQMSRSMQNASHSASMPFSFSQQQEFRPQPMRVFSEPAQMLDPPPSLHQVRSLSPSLGEPWANNNTSNNSSSPSDPVFQSASPSRSSTRVSSSMSLNTKSTATSVSSSSGSGPSSPSSQQRQKPVVIVYPAFQESKGAKTFEEMGIPIYEKRKGRCTIM